MAFLQSPTERILNALLQVGDHNLEMSIPLLIGDSLKEKKASLLKKAVESRGEATEKPKMHHIGYIGVVGATPDALTLLESCGRYTGKMNILANVPKLAEGHKFDIDELIEYIEPKTSSESPSKKKKRRKRNKNKKAANEEPAETETSFNRIFDEGSQESEFFDIVDKEELDEVVGASAGADDFLDKNFKFKSVNQPDVRVSSWDELKQLVDEVFPNDSELNTALQNKSQDSFDLWNFIVKYGKMYKEFVGEVLDMVNELKKALHETVDMHREKTKEVLESHKREMCVVKEKATETEGRIDILEKELQAYKQLSDEQRVKIFSQEEELDTLKKEHASKDKRLKNFENIKKSLTSEKNQIEVQMRSFLVEMQEARADLQRIQEENDVLKAKLKRADERNGECDYRVLELENRHYDDQTVIEGLQEQNKMLSLKVDDILSENCTLLKQIKDANDDDRTSSTKSNHSSSLFDDADIRVKCDPFQSDRTESATPAKEAIQRPIGSSSRRQPFNMALIGSDSMFSPGEEYNPNDPGTTCGGPFSRTIRKNEPVCIPEGNDDHPLLERREMDYDPWGKSSMSFTDIGYKSYPPLFNISPEQPVSNGFPSFEEEPPKRLPVRRSLNFSSLSLPP